MYRFYLVPIEVVDVYGEIYRFPKYFRSEFGQTTLPELIDANWGNLHYGVEDLMIVCSDVTEVQHNALAAQSDVVCVPADIDQNLTSGAVTITSKYLEQFKVPADWVNTTYTYRQILRIVAGMFMFVQRLGGLHKKKLADLGITLETKWKILPDAAKEKLQETAVSLNLDTSGMTAETKIRQMLKLLADQFDDWTYKVGGYQL